MLLQFFCLEALTVSPKRLKISARYKALHPQMATIFLSAS